MAVTQEDGYFIAFITSAIQQLLCFLSKAGVAHTIFHIPHSRAAYTAR